MSTKKISDFTALGESPANDDLLAVVDVSDTTDAASGTTKKITTANLLGGYLTGITGESIADLSDVDTDMTPSEGQAMVWSNADSEWQAQNISSGVGSRDFVASGAIGNGDVVIVNTDGTVSNISGTAAGLGSESDFESVYTAIHDIVYDPINESGVIIHRDVGDSSFLQSNVVNSSNKLVTVNTEVTVYSGSPGDTRGVYDPDSGNIVIAFPDSTGGGYGIVGSISGTSITYGTAVQYSSNVTQRTGICYDTANNKIVITYKDVTNSNRATAVIGTVSGTTISFGTPVVIDTNVGDNTSCTFDENLGKVVVSYVDSTSGILECKVGTVSGTTISFGSATTIYSGSINSYHKIVYDSVNQKVVVLYSDTTNGYSRAKVGTVSGTTISFGTENTFKSAASFYTTGCYDSASGKIIAGYRDNTAALTKAQYGTISGTTISFTGETTISTRNVNNIKVDAFINDGVNVFTYGYSVTTYGTAIAWTPEATTNATTENIAGIATAAISDTATGSVSIDGGISTNQTGLTAGQAYYVDDDGTLTTSDNSKPIGKAISSTSVLVQTL